MSFSASRRASTAAPLPPVSCRSGRASAPVHALLVQRRDVHNVGELRHGSRWGDNRGFDPRRSRLLKYLHIKRLRCLAGRIGASRGAAFAARHACVPETARRKFLQVARPQAVSRGDSRQLFAETRSCWPSSIKRPIPASERLGALHGIRRTPRGVRQPARAGLAHARHGSCVVWRTTRSRSGAQPPAASGCRGERSRSPARRVRRAPRIRLGRHGRTRRTVPRAGLRR
jgi:hypothetical protein